MEYTINVNGRLLSLSKPVVMGILNATPDSFYAASRVQTEEAVMARARQILDEGAEIIDVGACSTRPGGEVATEQEEMRRMRTALAAIRKVAPEAVVSVDTFRPEVARMAIDEFGAGIINDVSEGEDPAMFPLVAGKGVAYILMSLKPNLHDMLIAMAREVQQLRDLGQKDIILDPGFGFGKTMEENFALLREMDKMQVMDLPLLVGISRKRMIHQTLGITPDEALNGTTVLNTISLMKGASILRVHDVKEAVQAVKLFNHLNP
ncbi:dihydropteroate synthase [Prevotella sp. KH2C16]|uniref:dihydropteroate synthase n=1 Tax=Prevotella sp. KH2C16 TaxID=1855325 RepID=UPI0008E8CF6C|nr:dihydropteroate synthase [Prevotella sp. KH2C16]SFG05657.1 dihydropteroate synthase [Prevotella sp. KH2C16]